MRRLFESGLIVALAAGATPAPAQTAGPSGERMRTVALRVSDLEVRRQLASATPATVDSLLALYADSVVYEHPNAGAIIRGKEVMRGAMTQFIGSVRNVSPDAPRVTVGHGVAIVETNVGMEVQDAGKWVPVTRHGLRVIEFDSGAFVRRIIDYPW